MIASNEIDLDSLNNIIVILLRAAIDLVKLLKCGGTMKKSASPHKRA